MKVVLDTNVLVAALGLCRDCGDDAAPVLVAGEGEGIMSQYALRLPDSLLEAARRLSREEKASMNQLFVTAIAEKISALDTEKMLHQRALRGDVDSYRRALDRVPDVPPLHEEDRLD